MKDGTRRTFIFGAATLAAGSLLAGVSKVCSTAFAYDDEEPEPGGVVEIVQFADDGRRTGIVKAAVVAKSKDAWKKQLTPLQYDVTRRAATEYAFSGALDKEHAAGLYRCIDCDNALFDSKTKYDSGTGWPSFWTPIAPENVYEKLDSSYGTVRREVKCRLCNAHLGHVFEDGPRPTGLRYCMNSAALRFLPRDKA